MPAVAVAAKLGAPSHMGEEIQEELKKDLMRDPTTVGFSDVQIFDDRPVWQSISAAADVWTKEVAKQLNRCYAPVKQKGA